jgi:hypothetical protein
MLMMKEKLMFYFIKECERWKEKKREREKENELKKN